MQNHFHEKLNTIDTLIIHHVIRIDDTKEFIRFVAASKESSNERHITFVTVY